ncbi:carbohydrate-binding family 9-like protein [Candidatus Latescibacterota bacterium]
MRTFLLYFFSTLLFTSSLYADQPEYTVMRTTEKIVIDGILDEQDWESAPSFGSFQFPWWKTGDKEQTEVKMLWDDTFLYLSYTCEDKHIWADQYDTNANTYQDDCVEMFWDPNPSDPKRKYNMFEFNCIGNLLSVYVGSGENIHQRISRIMVPHIGQTLQGTVNDDSDEDTGWILEVAVRFSDYTELYDGSTPENGDMWRIGLNRCGGKINNQHSQWSPSQTDKPSFHRPEDFGKVFFSVKKVR